MPLEPPLYGIVVGGIVSTFLLPLIVVGGEVVISALLLNEVGGIVATYSSLLFVSVVCPNFSLLDLGGTVVAYDLLLESGVVVG